VDYILFNIPVPVLLCVIIAGVVNTVYFKEDSSFAFISFNREGIYSSDPEILLGSIPKCVDIMYKAEGLSLVFAKGIDLLVDRYPWLFITRFIMRYCNDGLFGKNSHALGDLFNWDETFSFPRYIPQDVHRITCRALHFYASSSSRFDIQSRKPVCEHHIQNGIIQHSYPL